MTDTVRLGAALSVLGTILEADGQRAKDIMWGWSYAPQTPSSGVRGGGLGSAGEQDRKDELRRQRRAAELHGEYTHVLKELERLTQDTMRILAVALPIHPSQLRNQRTGDLDPITPADVAAAGWCASCWRHDHQMVPIETQKRTGLRYYRDYCRWCGGFKGSYGIEPPLELLRLRHDGRSITTADVDAAVARVIAEQPKTKKAKRKAKRKAAA